MNSVRPSMSSGGCSCPPVSQDDSNAIDEDDRRFVLETTKGLVDQMRGQVKQDMQAQRQAFNPLKLLEQLDLPPLRGILKRDDEDAPPG